MSPVQKARAVSEAQVVLGVSGDASERDIHDAWKKLAFELHPDRGAVDSRALASVNAAYTLLKDRTKASLANNNVPAAPVKPVRPRSVRPSLPIRISKIDPQTQAECAKLVATEPAGHGHVAVSIERAGRKITYVVETELAEGVNRVAMPIEDFGDGGKIGPNTIAFRCSKDGPGTLDLPETIRQKVFPGMAAVRFRFAM